MKMAAIQGRPACEVHIATLPDAYDDIISLYQYKDRVIVFNEKRYEHIAEIEIMGSLFHEIRHAYQHHVILSKDENKENKETIEQWTKDFNNYVPPIDADKLQASLDTEDYISQQRKETHYKLKEMANQDPEKDAFDYLTAGIEVDALAFADLNIYNIYKVHLQIPKEMKTLVAQRQEEIKDRDDIIKI